MLEFITSPNNPDGTLRGPQHRDSLPVYDRAYYWPHFTPVQVLITRRAHKYFPVNRAGVNTMHFTPVQPLEDDNMMFTLSKLTGEKGAKLSLVPPYSPHMFY